MASAANGSHPTATRPEVKENDIEKKLVRMQKDIADSLGHELNLYEDYCMVFICANSNDVTAPQRDAELMELMKMHVRSGDTKAQGNESLQPLQLRSVITEGAAAELTIHRSVLPSVEEEDQDGEDGLLGESPAHTSSAGESGDELVTYEPPDALAVHFEDPRTGREYGLRSSSRRQAVGYTVAARTARRSQPKSRNPPCNMDAAEDAPLASHQPCNEPGTDCDERKAGDGRVPGSDATTQMRKRPRTASIIPEAHHVVS
ncbi:hypothetical protein PMIN02_010810 [Paraphaeosphaeria minitans]|uniref:Uncharacterized protein n=1 Tax=Paraphaeosphaeria minitans TaxID=565426 RepID=A0A9P6G7Q8_9PLEO|nr:hypothetical protein PMIN01_11923 [Paraphaeosphaeria minitans]